MSRLRRWIREADVVVWLLFALLVVGVALLIVVGVQTPNADCTTIIDDLQLPTLGGLE